MQLPCFGKFSPLITTTNEDYQQTCISNECRKLKKPKLFPDSSKRHSMLVELPSREGGTSVGIENDSVFSQLVPSSTCRSVTSTSAC